MSVPAFADGSSLDLAKATTAGLANGTVFRLVHNGTFADSNMTVKYQDVGAGSNVSVLELAPRDSIALVWNQASSSYLYAVGI